MPLPRQIHRNRPLENISVAYTPVGFIADELSPKIMVKHESDEYYVYSKNTMQLPQTLRADTAESNRAQWDVSTASYVLEEHAIHDYISDRMRDNQDEAINLDIDTTEFLTGIIKTRREVDLQVKVQTATNWANTTSLTSTLAWNSNTTTTNPITLVDSVASAILGQCGRKPNIVAMNDQSFDAAKEHVSVLERIKYTSSDSVTPDMLARLFNVDKVLVAYATYNNSEAGLTETLSRIWTDTAFVGWVDPTPKLKMVTALGTFQKRDSGSPHVVSKWRAEERKSDVVEVSTMFQNAFIATDCGHLIVNTNQ